MLAEMEDWYRSVEGRVNPERFTGSLSCSSQVDDSIHCEEMETFFEGGQPCHLPRCMLEQGYDGG